MRPQAPRAGFVAQRWPATSRSMTPGAAAFEWRNGAIGSIKVTMLTHPKQATP